MGLFGFLKRNRTALVRGTNSTEWSPETVIKTDNLCFSHDDSLDQIRLRNFQAVCQQAATLDTDLLIMSVLGSTCPDCAKYQGRVYSLSGNSKLFPPLPQTIKKNGIVHKGCRHSFFPYIHNVTATHMDYILKVHPLQNPKFGRNIVVFSNRPFVDDRTDECKYLAKKNIERHQIAKENKKRYETIIAQGEAEKKRDYQDYDWLKIHFPDKCPSSPTGYRRMKTQNTKRYQILKQLASELGKDI